MLQNSMCRKNKYGISRVNDDDKLIEQLENKFNVPQVIIFTFYYNKYFIFNQPDTMELISNPYFFFYCIF